MVNSLNNILQLKGRFEKRGINRTYGPTNLPANQKVSAKHMCELRQQLEKIKEYWMGNHDIDGALVSVHYTRIIAKTNRLRHLLSDKGKKPIDSICGAKFETQKDDSGRMIRKHVFTHYVQLSAIEKAIANLNIVIDILEQDYNGVITSDDTTEIIGKNKSYSYEAKIKKTNFIAVILDAFFVERFDIDMSSEPAEEDTIVTIYKTNIETKELLRRFGIEVLESRIMDGTTLLLDSGQMQTLYRNAPYLISMSVTDFTKINRETIINEEEIQFEEERLIPKPSNEPIVGVIDTQFNERVYFHEWVEYKNMLSVEIELEDKDFYHGTAVTSIIVDGPKGNPGLDDGCGRFRVRHFGVATQGGFSSFAVLRSIRDIVANNRDIKVWNLSLGSPQPIKDSFISPEAAELDRIQSEYDVIFVVAGTNTPDGRSHPDMKIGSPADSLNALVVNSANMQGRSASYTRKGPVLSFFHKPDISYYGGDGNKKEEQMAVCINDLGAIYRVGTSFAAPWITRKLAYLICVMGLSREVAKALLIDAAAKWSGTGRVSDTIGYGIVPKRIEDILHTNNDEIKFFMMGTVEEYETYNYHLPVPVVNGKHPFYARAVMCYFPSCDRNQGVDYTGTEMDIHFGRVQTNGKIKPIDDNKQAEEGQIVYEEDARKMYRKWDNIKRLCEEIKSRPVPRKSYTSGMWGISILTKERVSKKEKEPLQFGMVVTLKEMYGKNRIDEFMKSCMAHGWLVNRIDVQNQVDIYEQGEEEIELE